MTIISIVGTAGVGKSFLVKQLSAMRCLPAFFEGEEGTIPKEILESIFSGEHPIKRWTWFINRYKIFLEQAKKISAVGVDCLCDGSPLNAYAVLAYEDEAYRAELLMLANSIDYLEPDKTILLIASEEKIREFTKQRGRKVEKDDKAIERAMKIQDEYTRLAKERGLLIVNRTDLDFTKEKDLKFVWDEIRL
ncbi:hypothetical protein COV18_05160 [Candidatus Woesearchaeota archaeon CG10_big_fil_rev_8_21_14_0_10_37_12]|nr:MAG: hypothetical protein COV18_05160 [Candidatus Woesearchaeota archaeon CG10_big_fil_rev_8_21_14_0_10_37_12]